MTNFLDQQQAAAAEASLPVLAPGGKLREAQERLLRIVLRRQMFMRPIEKLTELNRRHFPREMRAVFDIVKNEPHRIIEIVRDNDPSHQELVRLYKMPIINVSEGEALKLAKQIVLSLVRAESNGAGTERAANGKSSAVHTNGDDDTIPPVSVQPAPEFERSTSEQTERKVCEQVPDQMPSHANGHGDDMRAGHDHERAANAKVWPVHINGEKASLVPDQKADATITEDIEVAGDDLTTPPPACAKVVIERVQAPTPKFPADKTTPPPMPTPKDKESSQIDELASLTKLDYDKRRKATAKEVGIRVSVLDGLVSQRRAELGGEVEERPLFDHWTVEAWPEAVDGPALIQAIVKRIQQHVILSNEAALAVALWIIMTWVHEEVAVHSPILMVTSPEANSGKTTLLGIIGFLVRRSLVSVGISPAVLYRSIEKWQPTLMIDEADVAFVQNDDLRTVVNSGWTRGQGVLRCDGDDNEPRLFSTFCPKAIGLKGKKLPDTTATRAIVIEMKRKLANEPVADFQHIDNDSLRDLRQQMSRWTTDNIETLREAIPTMPDGFINRTGANWRLLLAIAEVVGGEVPKKAREAAGIIARVRAAAEASIGIQLISDIRTLVSEQEPVVFSKVLVERLTAEPEKPWSEFKHGKALTQKQLANLLTSYCITSKTVWIDGTSAKGYERAAFAEAFERYL